MSIPTCDKTSLPGNLTIAVRVANGLKSANEDLTRKGQSVGTHIPLPFSWKTTQKKKRRRHGNRLKLPSTSKV